MSELASTNLSPVDLPEITDFYFPFARSDDPMADAWCYMGTPHAIQIKGTDLEPFAQKLVATVFNKTEQARNTHTQSIQQLAKQLAHVRKQDHATESDLQAAVNMSADQYLQLERRLREPRFELDGHIFRARWNHTVLEECLNLRRLPNATPTLDQINMPESWKAALQHDYDSGLILVCGKHGSGKSHTLAATIKSNLDLKGGFTFMVEDPPEFNLMGSHNSGMCIQTPVVTTWEEALSGSTRIFPTTSNTALVFGEIRDQVCAFNALEQADNGQTVFGTLHCGSVLGAIDRLATLVTTTMGEKQPYKVLASTLRCIIHQRLERIPMKNNQSQVHLVGEMLYIPKNDIAIQNLIRDMDKLPSLVSHIDKQTQKFKIAEDSNLHPSTVLETLDKQGVQHENTH